MLSVYYDQITSKYMAVLNSELQQMLIQSSPVKMWSMWLRPQPIHLILFAILNLSLATSFFVEFLPSLPVTDISLLPQLYHIASSEILFYICVQQLKKRVNKYNIINLS